MPLTALVRNFFCRICPACHDKICLEGDHHEEHDAMVLRHKPDERGLTPDEHGWCDADALVARINELQPFGIADLQKIVAEDSKQRCSFNEDGTLIYVTLMDR